MDDVYVEPVAIRGAAVKFGEDKAGTAHREQMTNAAAAGRAHPGFASGAASDACVQAWQSCLHTLGEQTDTAAAELTRAMDDFVSTDGDVVDGMRRQATWLEGA
ncbi:hypothetical protein POF50_008210 [Streptomyces sp. SL13]|uniref:ESX-1 secretion-associated protein n=1 Tax=Streptantibioticus silvisoli TaxID=2705255 RepID=A0AA90K7V7_9ACTN|nr:hypothetical protein [Streptantibioticus silvisoli]MDI5963459.1 hypothetical protein [Streptantibioticus silvisoli]MDI5969328.1 hypothetical protein [Streptantibioticus silvisoli]